VQAASLLPAFGVLQASHLQKAAGDGLTTNPNTAEYSQNPWEKWLEFGQIADRLPHPRTGKEPVRPNT